MKILVVCQYYFPEPFRITDICETLVNNGHDVTVLTGLPNYPEGYIHEDYRNGKRRKEVINGVKVIRSFELGRGRGNWRLFLNYISFTLSGSIKMMLIKEKFDVVLVNQLSPVMMAIPAIIYKKKHNKKILLYCLDLWPDSLTARGVKESSIIYKIFLKISKWVYKKADAILVTSGMFIDYFRRTIGISTEKITYLPQYAEDIFENCEKVSNDDKYHFVFAGNIGELQSVETIVQAANELRKHQNIVFHIVGDGSNLHKCKQECARLNLSNIVFYGRKPLSEMPYFYGIADAMLVTLKDNKILSYTLPGKVQSYMAAGKPIIGAINGETRRVIEESRCGFCCAAEDYKALAKIIIDFCKSDNKEEMAINSYKFYIENYRKENFISVLEKKLFDLRD